MQLSIRLVPVGDTTLVVVLTGELDMTTRPVLAAFLDPIPQSPVTHVVVAAGNLWFCDMSGLGQLILTHRALQAKGGHLAVAEAQPPLRRLLDLMVQHDTLPAIAVHTSMAAALSATDVEACQIDGPPAPMPRHLPRLRALRRELCSVDLSARPRRAARPRREPVGLPPTTPMTPTLVQSRALREQAAGRRQTLADRLSTAEETMTRLCDARRRCGDSLMALRATLLETRAAMAAEHH